MFNRFSSNPSGSNLNSQAQLSTPSSFYGAATPSSNSSPFSSNPFTSQSSQSLPLPSTPSVPYCLTNDTENGATIKLLAVSAMPAYRHLSHEEIRVEDYLKGRKGPSSFPGSKSGAFSQPFSTATPSSTSSSSFPFNKPTTPGFSSASGSSIFGSGGAFGTSTTGGFGTTSTGGFGGLTSSNPFGAAPTTPAITGFGTSTSSNVFGGAPSAGAFGQPQATQSTNIFGSTPGIFGQQAQAQTQQPTSPGFGGFGTSTAGTNPFAAKPVTSGGLFGSSAFGSSTATPAPSTTALFSGGFGSNTSANAFGSSFGQPQPQQQQFGTFGQPQPQAQAQAQPQTSLNPFAPSTTTTASGSTNLFGGTGSGGLFGSTTTATPTAPAIGGMFGTSTFGSTPVTGLFSSQPPQQPQQQSTGFAFGQAPTQTQPQTTGLFGSSGQTSGLFGGTSSTSMQRPAITGSSISTPSSTSIFGTGTGTSMFNRPTSNTSVGGLGTSSMFSLPSSTIGTTGGLGGSMQQPQGQLQGQLQGQPQGQLQGQPQGQPQGQFQGQGQVQFPIVSSTPLGSSSLTPPIPLNQISSHPQPQIQVQIPRSPIKFTPRTSFRIKPREAYNLTTPIPLNFNLTVPSATSTVLVPRKLSGASNIKKLVIPDFNEENKYKTIEENQNSNSPIHTNESSFSHIVTNNNNNNNNNNSNILTDSMPFGQQYTFPPVKVLKSLKPSERFEIKNLIIGQKGIGEIRFLLPVNLSEIDPEQIFGHFVEFCEGEAVLYPDPTISKPQPGQGLNLPAQVRLERIWTISKGSRDPIVDPKNEKVIHFIQKLKETPGTNFVSYDPGTGAWTFTVDHF